MHRSTDLKRLLILGLSGPTAGLNLWLLSQVFRYFEGLITVLVISAVIAFLLNYPVRLLEKVHIRRIPAVIIVLVITTAVLVIAGVTLVPLILDQTTQLLEKIPAWLGASQSNWQALDAWARSRNLPVDFNRVSTQLTTQLENQIQTLATQALGLALGTLSSLVDSLLVLVLSFYMLLYGDRLWRGLINLMPSQYGVPFSASLRLNFQNFFISQVILAGFMTAGLIPVFIWLQVPFALLFALVIGVAELIPFIGATLGIGLVVLLLMLQNFGLALRVAIAATLIQQIRDNIIAPRMMGNFTGLNPIWIFIALLMGLQIAGFLGILVAVPLAGTIKGTLDAVTNSGRGNNDATSERVQG
jgi:predicted PurR-regulated permease PerM